MGTANRMVTIGQQTGYHLAAAFSRSAKCRGGCRLGKCLDARKDQRDQAARHRKPGGSHPGVRCRRIRSQIEVANRPIRDDMNNLRIVAIAAIVMAEGVLPVTGWAQTERKSKRLNSSH